MTARILFAAGKTRGHRPRLQFAAFTFCSIVLMSLAVPLSAAAQSTRRVQDGVFSTDQAARGKSAFDLSCSRCHNVALTGSERGPAIKGSAFLSHWDKDTLAGLFS